MLVTRLTVVNACLASMGEEPINSLAESNAFTNSAIFALENATANEQSAGWWFNKEVLTIRPDIDGYYNVPADVIDLNIDANPNWLAMRNNRLYDVGVADYYKGTAPFKAHIIRLLDFENLPFHAKRLVKASTVLAFQQAYDGDSTKINEAQMEYSAAFTLCKSQHIRAVGANFGSYAARRAQMLGGGKLARPR